MGKKSSNKQPSVHKLQAGASPQLELSFVHRAIAGCNNVVAFPRQLAAPQTKKTSDSALKRLLDYAATLPGQ